MAPSKGHIHLHLALHTTVVTHATPFCVQQTTLHARSGHVLSAALSITARTCIYQDITESHAPPHSSYSSATATLPSRNYQPSSICFRAVYAPCPLAGRSRAASCRKSCVTYHSACLGKRQYHFEASLYYNQPSNGNKNSIQQRRMIALHRRPTLQNMHHTHSRRIK